MISTHSHFKLVMLLIKLDEQGLLNSTSVTALEIKLSVSRQLINSILNEFQRDNLIELVNMTHDKRSKFVILQPKFWTKLKTEFIILLNINFENKYSKEGVQNSRLKLQQY